MKKRTVKVYLSLGSNKGDRINYLKSAVQELKNNKEIKIINSSLIYETEPWGYKEQAVFLNCVLEIETNISHSDFFKYCINIEKKLGRKKKLKWQEREIDIDILFYDDMVNKEKNLTLPHREIENRRFVLVPLNEIAPDFIHPVLKKKISDLLLETKDESKVKKFI